MLIDTHVHLSDDCYKDSLEGIIAGLEANKVEKVINIGYDFNSSKIGYEMSQKYASVYAAVGVHPSNASEYNAQTEAFIRSVANNKKIVAIGEIGLDYYRGTEQKELQKSVFISQLKLANEFNLPVVIHIRDAYGDALTILKEHKHLLNNSGVLHCYGGSLEYAEEVLKLGLYFGFDGPITFKNSNTAEKVLKHLPIDRVLIETDSPYLTPHPYRGKINEPKYVGLVAQKMAETFNISEQELIEQTNKNAKNLFKKLSD